MGVEKPVLILSWNFRRDNPVAVSISAIADSLLIVGSEVCWGREGHGFLCGLRATVAEVFSDRGNHARGQNQQDA